jgi:N6-L-threonylcarbamoyladenine synthase
MKILGIESTCDETSAAVVEDGKRILSNVVATQFEFHREYAGVVPEIASRRHLEVINFVVEGALKRAGIGFREVDAVAVAHYPGLIGSLLVGLVAAKTISFSLGVPLIGVNHIEAHLYSVHFTNEVEYPIIGLIVSGGHTLLLVSERVGHYEVKGGTVDDAIGEAFDKVAKHLGLGYPGGPLIEKAARKGDERAYRFPRAVLKAAADRYNFSYSGLKNAVINQRERFLNEGYVETVENIAASFQAAATDVLLVKAKRAARDFGIGRIALAGGVANNARIREIFGREKTLTTYLPAAELTQDNGAMTAGLAFHKYREGKTSDLDLEPRSRLENSLKGQRARDVN